MIFNCKVLNVKSEEISGKGKNTSHLTLSTPHLTTPNTSHSKAKSEVGSVKNKNTSHITPNTLHFTGETL